jgi:SAM-dependent methyltransferase
MENTVTTSVHRSADSPYLFKNAGRETSARFAALSAMYDPGTISHLKNCGVGEGWRCLEVGGGGGSIAAWLADRVGPTGRVLVTDADPRFLEALEIPNLEVRKHDIANDPLPEKSFDLVHARMVLLHVPQREKALERMIAALKPGGWIIDEEFDSLSVSPDPSLNSGEVLLDTQLACLRLLADHGVERRMGRLLFARLKERGLVGVGAEARMSMWRCGSPGVSLMRSNYEQVREAMTKAGYITDRQIDQDIASLDSPAFMMPSPIMWTAWGRRPSS